MTFAARFLASAGGVALVLLAGNGLLRFLPVLRARPRSVRLAYAWLLGAGAVPAVLFALSHFFQVPLSRAPILSVFLLMAACALLPVRKSVPRPGKTPRTHAMP